MEVLTALQIETGKEIKRLITNFKKDSDHRKTIKYLDEKLATINSLWDDFERIDTQIRTSYGDKLDDEYFTSDYYTNVKQGYESLKDDIEKRLMTLSTMAKSSDNKTTSEKDPIPRSQKGEGADLISGGYQTAVNVQNNVLLKKQQLMIQALRRTLQKLKNMQIQQPKQFYTVKIRQIEGHWSEIERQHYTIWEQIEESTTGDYNVEDYYALEEETQEVLIKLYQEQEVNYESTNNNSLMKLPRIVLPKFDGSYLKWRQFHDLFSQTVHNQPMGAAQKMWYLKTNLIGEAERLIRHLPVTDENYHTAWTTLRTRYNNMRLLVNALLDKLLTQPSIQIESAGAIRTFHDTTKECLLGLQNLGISISTWDPILLHILSKRLDRTTLGLYEQALEAPRELQSLTKFLEFLETRFQSLEALGNTKNTANKLKSSALISSSSNSNKWHCRMCNKNHALFSCSEFLKLTPTERLKKAQKFNLCINCLRPGHNPSKCSSRGCLKCNDKHNTLLHLGSNTEKSQNKKSPSTGEGNSVTNLAARHDNHSNTAYILLGTAIIQVYDKHENAVNCRAILDSGSQLNFISDRLFKRLGLNSSKNHLDINGIGDSKAKTSKRVNTTICSKINGYSTQFEAYVIKEIASRQPQRYIDTRGWEIPKNIKLADPEFFTPQRVDILIGAEFFCDLLTVGQIKLGKNLPSLQNTTLGWIVLGKAAQSLHQEAFCGISNAELDARLQKFWAMDEEIEKRKLNTSEKECENHFDKNTTRDNTGRFVVKLPLSQNRTQLGLSKDIALKRFLSIERRLQRNPHLKEQYSNFMSEYLQLGHMEEVQLPDEKDAHYFLPHHCVSKPSSSTTQLRVVFDGSAKTSNNISLNDILLVGPTLQDDLFSIILRFRTHRYVFSADIAKMYRQILVEKEDRKLQMIMWRSSPDDPIKYYELKTVTYGTASAPYLAVKCLQRLAETGRYKYPLAAKVIKDFYVDDIMTGCDNLKEALQIQNQLRTLLKSGGFQLRKWCSNHPNLLLNVPKEEHEVQLNFNNDDVNEIKTLGLIWQPQRDMFALSVNDIETKRITKRSVLRDIAHIFDPLGLVNPVVVSGKIFMQHLWLLKLDWDEALPQELYTKWLNFRNEFERLRSIRVPRLVLASQHFGKIELHAFSDASEQAFGTAIYLRSTNSSGTVYTHLLCAKSRVAPLRKTTLPRLELCAAKLMAELVHQIRKKIGIKLDSIHYWSDSQIVLSWLKKPSCSYQTFVANRISIIHDLTEPNQWKYVNTKFNPADLVSRGVRPSQLLNCSLWFEGPEFLKKPPVEWPCEPFNIIHTTGEEKMHKTVLISGQGTDQHLLYRIDHKNSFIKLQRILAYVIKAVRTFKEKRRSRASSTLPSTEELTAAMNIIIKEIQGEAFPEEIQTLKQGKEMSHKNKLSTLVPFLDNQGIIRVGGRLKLSDLPYDTKHQILLPKSHIFTELIMNHLHQENLHVGPQNLHAISRQRFWILQGKDLAKKIVRNCIRCARAKPQLLNQLMGNLPKDRVREARPFLKTGVDFCGPIWSHYKIRGKRPQKCYIAIFCCFSTKAVHLEMVSDLTTEAFLGALKRFIARRGRCEKIYCDNATNFVGANNQLKELEAVFINQQSQDQINKTCAVKGIEFSFIPPRTPHFGGLWEAAVKSAKHLLQRSVAAASLTFEELCTVTAEIEAVLNSRPLTPMSSDPNDLTALTPGHFLIGEPLTAIPEPSPNSSQMNSRTRWKLVSYIRHEFWRRWSMEYLTQLQQRYKWKQHLRNVQPGMLVLLKDENLPSLKWQLGRIINVFKGEDGLVRVAEIKTASGNFKRAIHRLCPLPIEQEEEQKENDRSNKLEATKAKPIANKINKNKHHPLKGKFAPINPNWLKRPSTSITDEGSSEDINPEIGGNTKPAKRNSTATQETPPTKRVHKSSVILSTLLITCLLLPTNAMAHETIQVKPLNTQSGIYFEYIGQIRSATSEWSLCAYYDMKNYWAELQVIEQAIPRLKSLCSMVRLETYCPTIITQLELQVSDIKNNNEILLNQNDNNRNRRAKRGLINIVGNIANKLFGVLDEEYANNMTLTISNIKENEGYLLQLIKNQTSVIESTTNIIKRTDEDLSNQYKLINEDFDKITQQLNNMTSQMKQFMSIQRFTSLAIYLTLSLKDYQTTQATMLDIITDTHHGRANTLVISPTQLRAELTKIKEHLPPEFSLPEHYDETNIAKLYALMEVKGRITPKYTLFLIRIPLVTSAVFELFKPVTLPVYLNHTFIGIQPSMDFLMISPHRDQFCPMTQLEFSSCAILEAQKYVCKQLHPLYNKNANNCEVTLMNHMPLPPSCTLLISEPTKFWRPLHQPNHWLYSFDKEYTLHIVCESKTYRKTLSGNGLLNLHGNCIIKDDHITISSYSVFRSETMTYFQPAMNLSEHEEEIKEILPIHRKPLSQINHTTEIHKLRQSVTALKETQVSLKELQPHDIHQFSTIYITLSITGILLTYIIWTQRRTRHPTPAPRSPNRYRFSLHDGNSNAGEDV